MANWKNMDKLTSFAALVSTARVDLKDVMTGENGAERVRNYSVPMAEGLVFNYAAKAVDDDILIVEVLVCVRCAGDRLGVIVIDAEVRGGIDIA